MKANRTLYQGMVIVLAFSLLLSACQVDNKPVTGANRYLPAQAMPLNAGLASAMIKPLLGTWEDSDGDGLKDDQELDLARWYVPTLIFDEDEDKKLISTSSSLFQVTPTWKNVDNQKKLSYAIITYIFLYRRDKGADLSGCGFVDVLNWEAEIMRVFPGIEKHDIENIKSGHCGDAETIKIRVEPSGDLYQVKKIWIYRHGKNPAEYDVNDKRLAVQNISAGKAGCDASRGTCQYLGLYVSQWKHAMYVSEDECEAQDIKLKSKLGLSCKISIEDCGGTKPLYPQIDGAQNVGESNDHMNIQIGEISYQDEFLVPNGEIYQDEYIWQANGTDRDEWFCGGGSLDCGCGDGIYDNWEVYKPLVKTGSGSKPPGSESKPPSSSASDFLINMSSNKCLDVAGAGTTVNGAVLQIWDCEFNSSNTDQRWELKSDGTIRNKLSGKCLDVPGAAGTASGSVLQIYDCDGSKSGDQRWKIDPSGYIINLLSGKCVDVSGNSVGKNGTPVQLWDCEFNKPNATDQRWGWTNGSSISF